MYSFVTMKTFDSRASVSSYFVLCAVWVILGAGFTFLEIKKGGGDWHGPLLMFGVALGFALWLAGFRIKVENGELVSRDGLYRSRSCQLSDIQSIDLRWITQQWLWKRTSALRIVITLRDGRELLINPKPFSSRAISTLQRLIREYPTTR